LSGHLKPLFDAYVIGMIERNAEPIGHISPYPRIDLSPVRPLPAQARGLSALMEKKHPAEVERIWRLVVQAAEAS
jgi:hypothetical protein